MLSILITGGSGMLGTALKRQLPEADYLEGREDLNLAYPEVADTIKSIKFYDVIIHTAAITDLPLCEQNPYQAQHLHADVIKLLQEKCHKLIYISAQGRDYDNIYFKTKMQGEVNTLRRKGDTVIRVNIYGDGGLVKWATGELRKGNKINGYSNVIFNPVHVDQLSRFIREYGLSSEGLISVMADETLTKYEFLDRIAAKQGLDTSLIKPTPTSTHLNLTVKEGKDNRYYSLKEGIDLL